MSFGSGFGSNTGGGFGGFGQNNTSTSGSLFGSNNTATAGAGGFGFGSQNQNNSNPFGAPKTTGFGAPATNTGTSLFGGSNNNTGGFGSNAGATLSTGFGSTNNSGTSLFGGNKTSGFGGGTTGGSLFGGGTSGFGSNNNATSNPFGGASNTNTGFGASNNNASGFGASNNSTFGSFGNNTANNAAVGTAATPFQPFTEKDGTAGQTAAYQSITMQAPYQGKSFEELRLEDYTQNRRYPQSGSFGSSNTFGGFGSTNNSTTAARPSLFGAANTGSSFNAATNTSTGFGSGSTTGFGATNNATTGSSLFGQAPKPGGLFGSGNSTGGFGTSTTANTGSAGLFGGTANNTSSGGLFGQGNNASSTTSGGLFGQQNNQQPKTGFGTGFGATNNATTTGFGAANNNTSSGGLFGSTTNNTTGFGATNNASNSLFGGAAKPGGLFGAPAATNTSNTGLFGQSNNTTGGGGLFGGANTQNNAGGSSLFGASQPAKPAGLFGAPAATNNNSLFGSTANNTQGGGLFGSGNTQGSSLFGQPKTNTFGAAGGSSLFGNTNTTNTFGNQAQAGNSLFGSQNGANGLMASQGPQQNQLTASITGDPYGNAQLFASLAAPSPPVGPLATPLSGAKPAPKARASLLASVRGGSPMLGASTSLTPRGRPGYGFSYSTLNTPTGTPVLTPGASSLLRPAGSMGPGMSSRLSKSFSTSNLRGEGGEGSSLLRTPAPGQSSLLLGSGSLGSGSIRRLKIDRSLRTDLFGDTPKKIDSKEADKEPELRKRVSFDKSAEKEAATPTSAKPSANNALVVHEEETPKAPEMSQINPLATVPEEGDKSPRRPIDAGEYYTEPSLKQIKSMSRGQLQSIKSFTVGRQGVGKIEFGRDGTVDLSSVPLDDICGKIVQLKPRSATVYEDDSDKPPVGRGLNLPSTIWLEQSWPRASRNSSANPQPTAQKDIDRHKARLKRVGGTKFLDYDDSTGIWSFTVEHFTTYELDDDEETTVHDSTVETAAKAPSDISDIPDLGEQDDTFQFKLAQRSQGSLNLPGGFDDSMANIPFDHDDTSADEMQEDDHAQAGNLGDSFMIDPFLEDAAAVQPPSHDLDQYQDDMEEDQELPGSFHAEPDALKSILKPSAFEESLFRDVDNFADLSWEEQLQRTLSPKKQDRQALRDLQARHVEKGPSESDSLLKKSLLTRSQLGASHLATKSARKNDAAKHSEAFTTSMDIMRSLWADAKAPAAKAAQNKRAPNDTDVQFHNAFKPSFANGETVLFKGTGQLKQNGDMTVPLKPAGEQSDVKISQKPTARDQNSIVMLKLQQAKENTSVEIDDDVEMDDDDEGLNMPEATTNNRIILKRVANAVDASASHEKRIWELCSVLFDPLEVCAAESIRELDDESINELQSQIRRDIFLGFWTSLIAKSTQEQLRRAKTAEEKAVLHLCLGDILSASEILMTAGNPRLAIQLAQLPASDTCRDIAKKQIEDWQKRKDWSEISVGQRALYSILAGNVSRVPGTGKAAPEDRVAEFDIGTAFGLTWQQCLALRVRFSGEESLPHAVDAYVNDLTDGVEVVKPLAWSGEVDREDTLLSLLKLMTEQASPNDLLDPLAVSGSVSQNRLAWQLATLLSARNMLHPGDDEMDKLTVDLSAELEGTGDYLDALWVLLHLTDPYSRYTAVKALLERNGSKIPDPVREGKTGDFEVITVDLVIPASLVWYAKALYAKGSLQDPVLQCKYLLKANTQETLQEAHDVLCQKVGPNAVIEQYYDDLDDLTGQFDALEQKPFDGWSTGGLLYLQLVALLSSTTTRGREYEALLKQLNKGLKAQQDAGEQGLTLEMRVARIEMRKIVTERVKQIDESEKWLNGVAVEAAKFNKGMAMFEQYKQALGEVH